MKSPIFCALSALILFSACIEADDSLDSSKGVIYALIDQGTSSKSVMGDDNSVLWSEDDQIIAFMNSSLGQKYMVAQESIGKTFARFDEIESESDDFCSGVELDHNIAYYPYDSDVECLKVGDGYELSVELSSEQKYVRNSFGANSLHMAAVSETDNFAFRNICGGIKLQFTGTQRVRSIKIEGKNSEKLSGPAVVTIYTDDDRPAIIMEPSAVEYVTLDCGTGVQLKEDAVTEFIIVLPPVLFRNGFNVTVTDSEGTDHIIGTDKANTILRSSLLVMPPLVLDEPLDEDDSYVPVEKIKLSMKSLTLAPRHTYTLTARIIPAGATDQTVVWSSDNPSVIAIDHSGTLTALAPGNANVYAEVGGIAEVCSVSVYPHTTATIDYIDEYGVNHGKGIAIGDVVWAPVNCGYHKDDFKYGKLYQWGRKYGQGYSGPLYIDDEEAGTYSDAVVPEVMAGPISSINGQKEKYSNVFFKAEVEPYNWVSPFDDNLWNSGTEELPAKAKYDPCPEGWRVPTYNEMNALRQNGSSKGVCNGQVGCCFTGVYTYMEDAQQLFLPIAGRITRDGVAQSRGQYHQGAYWTSKPRRVSGAHSGHILSFNVNAGSAMSHTSRAEGLPVRCVQE